MNRTRTDSRGPKGGSRAIRRIPLTTAWTSVAWIHRGCRRRVKRGRRAPRCFQVTLAISRWDGDDGAVGVDACGAKTNVVDRSDDFADLERISDADRLVEDDEAPATTFRASSGPRALRRCPRRRVPRAPAWRRRTGVSSKRQQPAEHQQRSRRHAGRHAGASPRPPGSIGKTAGARTARPRRSRARAARRCRR